MPSLSKHQINEIAGRLEIDPRTAEALIEKFRAGKVPPAAKLALELARRGIEVVPAPAVGAL